MSENGDPPPYPPPPPTNPQQPYPQQPYPPQPYPQQPYGYQPYPPYGGYAAPEHPQANTALILGLVAVAGSFMTCGLTLVAAPFAWVIGLKAKRAIAAAPGQYTGDSKANAGFVMGIIGTVLLAIALIVIAIIVAIGVSEGWDTYEDDGPTYSDFGSPT